MSHTPVDRFTCEEMVRRLDDYLDRELSAEEMRLAREHLETCAACAKEFAFEAGALVELKRKLRRIDLPASLVDRVAMALARARAEKGAAHEGDGRA